MYPQDDINSIYAPQRIHFFRGHCSRKDVSVTWREGYLFPEGALWPSMYPTGGIMEKFQNLSLASRHGLQLLAAEIRLRRKLMQWSEQDLADRLGCARKTVRAIEEGRPTVAIGYALEAAVLVGIDLFGGGVAVSKKLSEARARLDLLPQRTHQRRPEVNDDF